MGARSLSAMAPNTACVVGKSPWRPGSPPAPPPNAGCAPHPAPGPAGRHDLEAPGQLHPRQPQAHRLRRDRQALAQRLQRRQRARGVDELIGPAAPDEARPANAARARPGPLLLVARIVEVPPEAPQVGADLLRLIDHALRRQRVADQTTGRPARMMPAFSRPIVHGLTRETHGRCPRW